MKCMFCNHLDSKVIDSRPAEDGSSIRRRRECTNCGRRFTTYEKVETPIILVVKKNGQREQFDINKVRNGLIKACEKRPITAVEIEKIVSDIEKKVNNTLEQEISSHNIGELVMDSLRDLDQIAYVRFASVYRQFKDITNFRDELDKLIQ